jgi:pimeloyl-ACP methyl ester carboxylesterase
VARREDIVRPGVADGGEDRIETGSVVVDGVAVFFRRIPGEGPPAVLVHGVPNHSELWQPFLERMRGPALAFDLPGFGRSDRPDPAAYDYSARGQGAFFARALEALGVGDHVLCVHDWGSIGLIPAQREPDRVKRLCIINAVPFLPGYRWHRTARGWRTPVLGELSLRLFTRRTLALGLRESRGDWSAPPPEFVDMISDHLDRGTKDAILRLYRSAPPEELVRLGEGLGAIEAPALVVWAEKDRYLPVRFGRAYADALPGGEFLELPGLGHWPWLEDSSLVDRIVAFLEP